MEGDSGDFAHDDVEVVVVKEKILIAQTHLQTET
jgi:hypothetical protein